MKFPIFEKADKKTRQRDTYPAHFSLLGQHDNDCGIVFPEHPPEVVNSLIQGSLGGNVGISVSIAINVASVDVIASFDTPERLEADPCRLIGQDVHEPVLELVHGQVGRHEPRGLRGHVGQLLELHLHGGDVLPRLVLHELLDVVVEAATGDLGVAGHDGLEESLMNKDILILSLYHVVSLRPQAGDMSINVQGFLMLHPLQHRVNDNEGTCPADSSTEIKTGSKH